MLPESYNPGTKTPYTDLIPTWIVCPRALDVPPAEMFIVKLPCAPPPVVTSVLELAGAAPALLPKGLSPHATATPLVFPPSDPNPFSTEGFVPSTELDKVFP